MRQNRLLKGILIGIFVVVTGAITVNFLDKLAQRSEAPIVEPLAEDTEQLSREVEFKNYDGEDVVFQVRSAEASVNEEGIQDLAKVNLNIFRPPERESADRVWAESARYDVARKAVEFEKDVSISLEDSTEILSQRASADLEEQEVRIEKAFSLRRGEVEGEGRALLYDAGKNRLDVEDGIHLRIPEGEGVVDIRALTASYWPRLGKLLLVGQCRIKSAAQNLAAEKLDIQLTGEQKLRLATAVGTVVFESADVVIEGDRLSLEFGPQQGRVLSFRLAAKTAQRALYRRGPGAGAQILRARLITGVLAPESRPDEMLLQRLEATGNIQIEWREAGIDKVKADHLTGVSRSGLQFEDLAFKGQVELVRHSGEGRETIRSEELHVTLAPGALLQQLIARNQPVLVADGSLVKRTLEAEKEIQVFFQEGQLARVESVGRSRIVEESSTQMTAIQAAGLRIDYENSVPVSLLATGPVRLERGLERPLIAEARDMRVTYDDEGGLKEAELLGNLELTQEAPDGLIQLSGQKGIITDGGGIIEVTGEPCPVLRSLTKENELASRTTATSFRLDASNHGIQADGQVETQVAGDQPLTIKAEEMKAGGESSWILYQGRPRLEFGENRIESDRMRLESRRLILEAEGRITAFVQTTQAEEPTGYRIKADRLVLDRQSREAVFSGRVWAESEAFEVEASEMTLWFDGPDLKTLLQMTALGEVSLAEEGRRATGDKAIYLPAEGRVTVEGKLAQVIDSTQGKATGRKLTFTLGDDTLVIEGQQ